MDLVRDHGRQTGSRGQLCQLCDEPVIIGLEVVAELNVEVAIGEMAAPGADCLERRGMVTGQEKPRHLPIPAPGEADEVPARLVERRGHERAFEDRELLFARQVAA